MVSLELQSAVNKGKNSNRTYTSMYWMSCNVLPSRKTLDTEFVALTYLALFSRQPHPTFGMELLDIQVSMLYTCLSGWEKPTELLKSQMRHDKGHNLDLTSPSCSGKCRASVPPWIEACQRICMRVKSEWRGWRCCPSPNQYHALPLGPHLSTMAAHSDRPPTIQHPATISIPGLWSLNSANSTTPSGASVLQ